MNITRFSYDGVNSCGYCLLDQWVSWFSSKGPGEVRKTLTSPEEGVYLICRASYSGPALSQRFIFRKSHFYPGSPLHKTGALDLMVVGGKDPQVSEGGESSLPVQTVLCLVLRLTTRLKSHSCLVSPQYSCHRRGSIRPSHPPHPTHSITPQNLP